MATRRSRIKGIANIPQRRKADSKLADETSLPLKLEPEAECAPAVAEPEVAPSVVAPEPAPVISVSAVSPSTDVIAEASSESINVAPQQAESSSVPIIEKISIKPPPESLEPPKSIALPRRRTFIKPIVNAKALSQKLKPKLERCKLEETKSEETSIVEPVTESASASNKAPQNVSQNHLSLPSPVQPLPPPIKFAFSTHAKGATVGSDSEYVAEPLSPTKVVNRSRIKAVPRLSQRRTSITIHGSASESEDDTKKNFKRIRTESACSNVSVSNEPQIRADPGSPQKSKEFSSIIQRKCKRTEQSRKMAEARRHFMHKFGNKTPDKQKLTMIDLIFYNPNTNPMSQKPKKQPLVKTDEDDLPPEEPKSPEPDDVPMESDEENTIPAPQIKIGANGEIVVDEKSLVIENIQTRKEREELQKSELVDGDFDTGYGIYKREKRSKDWSKEETLRFYKALNTLGTDFTLMVQLFSGRSRRELKMKFKKEERVNRLLVDKALTRPVEFNIKELQEEVENIKKNAELEQANKEKMAQEWASDNKDSVVPYSYERVKKKPPQNKVLKREKQKKKKGNLYSKLRKGITCVWGSDSEDENLLPKIERDPLGSMLRRTRSGRVPKPRQAFDYAPTSSTETPKEEPQDSSAPQNENGLQPGSLMIVYSQTPTGEPTFKVFMVTPCQNKVPITLTPDMLNNLTQSVDNPNIHIEQPENNYTIAHDSTDATDGVEENMSESSREQIKILPEAIEEQICPYEQQNVGVPVDNTDALPENNVSLCTDGKYDIMLKTT